MAHRSAQIVADKFLGLLLVPDFVLFLVSLFGLWVPLPARKLVLTLAVEPVELVCLCVLKVVLFFSNMARPQLAVNQTLILALFLVVQVVVPIFTLLNRQLTLNIVVLTNIARDML